MPALTTYTTQVHPDWVDYNGHLRDAFYLLIFSYATDALMDRLGMDSNNLEARGHSLFTLELHLNYLHDVKLDADVEVHTQIIAHHQKRLHPPRPPLPSPVRSVRGHGLPWHPRAGRPDRAARKRSAARKASPPRKP